MWCHHPSSTVIYREGVCSRSSSIDNRQRGCVSLSDSRSWCVVVSSSIDGRQRGCVSLSLIVAHGVWWWMVIHRWCALLSFRMADRGCVSVSDGRSFFIANYSRDGVCIIHRWPTEGVCGGVPDIPSVIIHHRQSSTEGVCSRSSSIDNRQRGCVSLSLIAAHGVWWWMVIHR